MLQIFPKAMMALADLEGGGGGMGVAPPPFKFFKNKGLIKKSLAPK